MNPKRERITIGGMTEACKAIYDLVDNYLLGEFFNPYMGNIIVDNEKITDEVKLKVEIFLRNNKEWVMGYEHGSMYVAKAKDLN